MYETGDITCSHVWATVGAEPDSFVTYLSTKQKQMHAESTSACIRLFIQ